MIKIRIYIVFLIMLCLISCRKDEYILPIVFTGKVTNITPEGVTAYGKISNVEFDKIIEHGFVWDTRKEPTIEHSYIRYLGELQDTEFTTSIQEALIESTAYHIRAFVIDEKNIVYGQSESFVSLGSKRPEINSFSPVMAYWGDTIYIQGKYLSTKIEEVEVTFNSHASEILFTKDTIIAVIVPENLDSVTATINISVIGNIFTAKEKFLLSPPKIISFKPSEGSYETIVQISGKYFKNGLTKVYFGNKNAVITDISNERLLVNVPSGVPEGHIFINVHVLGQETISSETFYYKAPVITGISTNTGTWGDQIEITGRNFDDRPNYNIVKFNNVAAEVLSSNSSSLTVKVPADLANKHSNLSVTVNSQTFTFDEVFTLLDPEISSISPIIGTFEDIINIHGTNLNPKANRNYVYFENVTAHVLEATSSLLKVVVPTALNKTENTIKLVIGDMESVAVQKFTLNMHSITSISPINGSSGQIMTIEGYGFNPLKQYNTVHIGDVIAEVISSDNSYINVEIPNELSHGNHQVKVTILGRETVSSSFFMMYQPWTKLSNPPFGPRHGMCSFSIGNRHFVGGGQVSSHSVNYRDFWEYSPSSDSWIIRTSIPTSVSNASTFSTESRGYVITEYSLFMYNPDTDHWTYLGGIPYESFSQSTFTINNYSYIVSGSSSNPEFFPKDTYMFDPSNNTWTKKQDYPYYGITGGIGFKLNDMGYVGLGRERQYYPENKLWKYDPNTDNWSEQLSFSGVVQGVSEKRTNMVVFTINNKAYFGTGRNSWTSNIKYYNDFYEIDLSLNEVRRILNFMGERRAGAFGFFNDQFGFIGGGILINSDGVSTTFGDFYKFDPQKLPPEN